jgi:hypothetical protein
MPQTSNTLPPKWVHCRLLRRMTFTLHPRMSTPKLLLGMALIIAFVEAGAAQVLPESNEALASEFRRAQRTASAILGREHLRRVEKLRSCTADTDCIWVHLPGRCRDCCECPTILISATEQAAYDGMATALLSKVCTEQPALDLIDCLCGACIRRAVCRNRLCIDLSRTGK